MNSYGNALPPGQKEWDGWNVIFAQEEQHSDIYTKHDKELHKKITGQTPKS